MRRWLDKNEDAVRQLIGCNPDLVGDALLKDTRLEGARGSVVLSTLEKARPELDLLSAVIYHHAGADAYDNHVWPIVLMLRGKLEGGLLIDPRGGATVHLRRLACAYAPGWPLAESRALSRYGAHEQL